MASRAALRRLAAPLAWAYGAAVARRNRRFDRGVGVRRVGIPVIAVGNIVVGGTGKTPMVAWTVRTLRGAGASPMIALRGYGSDDPQRADEVIEYRDVLGNVPIAAGADRFATISAMLGRAREANRGDAPTGAPAARAVAPDVVVLDDGFQHRALHRDLDLVLVDRRRPCLDEAILPCGPLREPARALARADGVIVTHADGVDDALAAAIEALHGKAPLAWFRHVWRGLELHAGAAIPAHDKENDGGDGGAGNRVDRSKGDDRADDGSAAAWHATRSEPTSWLSGRRVGVVLGIANPSGVHDSLRRAGARVVADVPARDHQRYDGAFALRAVERCRAAGADALVTTRKDWVKLREVLGASAELRRGLAGMPIVVPWLDVEPVAGGEALGTRIVEAWRGRGMAFTGAP